MSDRCRLARLEDVAPPLGQLGVWYYAIDGGVGDGADDYLVTDNSNPGADPYGYFYFGSDISMAFTIGTLPTDTQGRRYYRPGSGQHNYGYRYTIGAVQETIPFAGRNYYYYQICKTLADIEAP